MKHFKVTLVMGIMACLLSTSAFAATVEQDKATQETALKYNQQYDINHGYTNGAMELSEEEYEEVEEAVEVVKEKKKPNQPVMREEVRAKKEAPPVIRPGKTDSKKPQWVIDCENDKKTQEEALEFNRNYDAERGLTNE